MAQELSERISFTSSQVTGGGDVNKLEDNLSPVEGVRDVNVDANAHTVEIIFDPTVTSATKLRAEVEDLGYKIDSDADTTSAG